MAQFVKQHKQHIAGYKFHEALTIFRRKLFESRIIAKLLHGGVDPRLKLLRFGRGGLLRKCGLGGEHECHWQQKRHIWPTEMPKFHSSTLPESVFAMRRFSRWRPTQLYAVASWHNAHSRCASAAAPGRSGHGG